MLGKLISLDGLDGGGKSTQIRLLAQWLKSSGKTVVECADPGGTEIGAVLRQILLEHRGHLTLPCEAFLFMASRAQLVSEIIRPALEKGHWVLCDRFVLANVVYQGHAGGIDPEMLWAMGKLSTANLEPDCTFVLDLPEAVARTRWKGGGDRMENRGADFHAKVRAGFLKEAQRNPNRIKVIDASQTVETVHQQLIKEIERIGGK